MAEVKKSASFVTKHKDCAAIIFSCLMSLPVFACDMKLNIPLLESEKDHLIFSLLELALSKTRKNICFIQITQVNTDARKSRNVMDGSLSVKWASASSLPDKNLLPIKIPIFEGLTGYRVMVIRAEDQSRFDKVESLADLQRFVAGQGLFWGDAEILRRAGLNVTTSAQARHLWAMLANKRFDYIPLAIHEPWRELELRPELHLAVEKRLMLVYPSAMFFYVAKENDTLFKLISFGMDAALMTVVMINCFSALR